MKPHKQGNNMKLLLLSLLLLFTGNVFAVEITSFTWLPQPEVNYTSTVNSITSTNAGIYVNVKSNENFASGEGSMEFTIPVGTIANGSYNLYVGLQNNPQLDGSVDRTDVGFSFTNNFGSPNVDVRYGTNNSPDLGPWADGDTFKVEVLANGDVNFYKNTVLVHSFVAAFYAVTYPLAVGYTQGLNAGQGIEAIKMIYPSPNVNGVCGADDGAALPVTPTNLCSAGTPSAVAGTGPWTWTCIGTGTGTTANCSANLNGGFIPFPAVNPPSNSITAKGNLLTSDGVNQIEFPACAVNEVLIFDPAEVSGMKCGAN